MKSDQPIPYSLRRINFRCCHPFIPEFVLFSSFVLGHIAVFFWARYGMKQKNQWDVHETADDILQFYGLLLGYMSSYHFSIALPLSIRNQLWPSYIFFSLSFRMHYQRIVTWCGIVSLTLHSVFLGSNWVLDHVDPSYPFVNLGPLCGIISAFVLVILSITSLRPIRRTYWSVFSTAQLFTLPALSLAVIHSWYAQYSKTSHYDMLLLYVLSPGVVLYSIDLLLRLRKRWGHVHVVELTTRGSHTVLTLNKPGFNFDRCQIAFVRITSTPDDERLRQINQDSDNDFISSWWQRPEPYVVMPDFQQLDTPDGSYSSNFTLCIKDLAEDSWTHRLAMYRGANEPSVSIEGPYGSDYLAYEAIASWSSVLILVAAGRGLACHASFLQSLYTSQAETELSEKRFKTQYPGLTAVHIHWTLRNIELLNVFAPLFLRLQQHSLFKAFVYVTDRGGRSDRHTSDVRSLQRAGVSTQTGRMDVEHIFAPLAAHLATTTHIDRAKFYRNQRKISQDNSFDSSYHYEEVEEEFHPRDCGIGVCVNAPKGLSSAIRQRCVENPWYQHPTQDIPPARLVYWEDFSPF